MDEIALIVDRPIFVVINYSAVKIIGRVYSNAHHTSQIGEN